MRHAAWVVLFVLVVAPSAGADDGVAPAPTFDLGLERCDLAVPGAFRLATGGPATPAEPAQVASDPPTPAPGLALSLTWTPDDERVPEGLRMRFKERGWDELDGWEKTGYVLAQTSAAAGLAYLVYRLVD